MLDELYMNGMIEVIYRETAIARMFPFEKQTLVKMLLDGYEFSCDSVVTARQLIKIRMGIQ